jgi:hypothetical protein
MSFDAKLAALAIVMLLALAIYGVMSSVVVSGSGGLGAGSAGLSEAVLEFLVLAVLVCAFAYWRHRRHRLPSPKSRPVRVGLFALHSDQSLPHGSRLAIRPLSKQT